MLILLRRTGSLFSSTRTFWNTLTKAEETDVSIGGYWNRGNGAKCLIDVYESGGDLVLVFYENTSISTTVISGLKLLSLTNDTTGTRKVFTYFSVTNKITITDSWIHGDSVGVGVYPAFNNTYIRSTLDVLATQCIGVNLNTWSSDGAGGVAKSITYNSASCGFVPISNGTVVTESIVIKLDNDCKDNAIYLRWLNSLGGFDYYMFHYTNEIEYEMKSLGDFKRPFVSLAEKNNSYNRGKSVSKSLRVGAELLNQNDFDGIFPDLLMATYISIVDQTGADTPVKIREGSWSMTSRDKVHSIEFELELPEHFAITR